MAASPDDLLGRIAQARRDGRAEELRPELVAALPEWTGESRAQALAVLGQLDRDLGHFAAARTQYEQAAALYRGHNPLRLAHTVRHIADIYVEERNFAAAEPLYAEALTIYRSHNAATLDLANAVRGLAVLKQHLAADSEARALWSEARDLYRAAGIEPGVAESTRRIAQLGGEPPTP